MVYAFFMTTSKIHIGHLIRQQLKEQGRSVTWFAQRLNYDRSNAYKIFSKPHIDTDLLLTISKVLNYNFFCVYAEQLATNKNE